MAACTKRNCIKLERMDVLTIITNWATPTAVGVLIGILIKIKTLRSRVAKADHDAYKAMYDDLRATTEDLSERFNTLINEVTKLKRWLAQARKCRYYSAECPVYPGLRHDEKTRKKLPKGGYGSNPKGYNEAVDSSHTARDGDNESRDKSTTGALADAGGPPG